MDEIVKDVQYPSAPLTLCSRAPITDGEIGALSQELGTQPTFRGAWTIAADGLPVAILHAIDHRHFQAARALMTGVLAWNWNHHFGKLLSFSLVVPRERMPRMFVSDDSALVRAVAERGRIAFAVGHEKRLTPFYLADFTQHPKHPNMLDAFRALLRFPDSGHFVFRDDEVAFWLLMANKKMHWHKDLPDRDAARARWAITYEYALRDLCEALAQRHSANLSDPYATEDARTNVPVVMPFFDEIARLLVSPTTSGQEVVNAVSAALGSPKKVGDLVHGMFAAFQQGILVDDLQWLVRDSLWAALLSPQSTKCGLRRPWLDGRAGVGDVAVRFIELDYDLLGKESRGYWTDYELSELFDLGYVITGRDAPIPRIPLYKALANLKLDCTVQEADNAIRDILAEAREGRQWSAPWGARVQVDIGPLKYLDIHEIEGEFVGLFRDSNERFLMLSVNVSTGNYGIPRILRADDGQNVEDNTDAPLALALVVASAVRDFLVVENREAQFSTKAAKELRCSTNRELSVIYLPRVRYLRPDVKAYHQRCGGDVQRTAHEVAGHIRRVEQPSSAQLLLALRYGFTVPQGYTFVRPHRRGDAVTQQRQHIYRSRSVSAIIYRTIAKAPAGTRPAWFDFEKDVAALMVSKGLRVIHQAASRRGDGGVDIFAHDETKDVLWAIQCKCYAPARKVGPDVVRELSGSLHRYPEGTRAMIVTTSSFTPAAIQEAGALRFETVDGQQFAALLKTMPSRLQ